MPSSPIQLTLAQQKKRDAKLAKALEKAVADWKGARGAPRERKNELERDDGSEDRVLLIISKEVEKLLSSKSQRDEDKALLIVSKEVEKLFSSLSNKNERQQDDGTSVENAMMVVSEQVEKFLLFDEEIRGITAKIVEQRNDEMLEDLLARGITDSARDVPEGVPMKDSTLSSVPKKEKNSALSIFAEPGPSMPKYVGGRPPSLENGSSLTDVADYFKVEPSLSLISASDMSVRERQPLGGPKYYIATITEAGQARVIHEAMPTKGVDPRAVAEEMGYEILEYNLEKKERGRSCWMPLSKEEPRPTGWFERAVSNLLSRTE